jgi:hypothetical protein
MQLAVAAGAPLGRFTVGGRFRGRLPPPWRGLAVVQAGLLLLMAMTMLERGGAVAAGLPEWLYWPALGLTALTCLANIATPSPPERMLWGPVTAAMLVAALMLA